MFEYLKKIFKSFFYPLKKKNLHAVYEDDILEFLESTGLKETLEAGKEKCFICNEPVTLESFQAIIKQEGGFVFVCNKKDCISSINE